ncbi:MAG: thiamine-phosphate kinase [Phycisphaerae bacterium]|nr:thiamine-phosphate kinase [Phycisphaerae bacterium]
MPEGENALVQWLRERFVADATRVPVGIGDDLAAVRLDGSLVAVTADMLLDGVHFETGRHSFEAIGRKALACSLSDCAAAACWPRAATVSVALPPTMTLADVQRLYEGMGRLADEFRCPIVGGDTTSWRGRLAIDVTVLAEPMAPNRGPMRRCGARAGDTIFVSGPLGGSLVGRHMEFVPRLDLAALLAGEPGLHAMMDISDGLAMDLDRLCRASACDAELSAEALAGMVSADAQAMAETDGRTPLDHALSDGEDFELLVVGEAALADLRVSTGGGLIPVGRIVVCSTAGRSAMTLLSADGRREPLEPRGYEHFR